MTDTPIDETQDSPSNKPLQAGDYAPDFTLDANNGKTVTLSELRGKIIALYFYPKDDTPGCTIQAEGFRDLYTEFKKLDVTLIGISKDSLKRHNNFVEKYDLPFILASDEKGSVCEAYGCWIQKSMYGKQFMGIARDSFLIDREGKIRRVWRKAKPSENPQDMLLEATTLL